MIALISAPTILLLTGLISLLGAGMLIWLRDDHRDNGSALMLFAGGVLSLWLGFVAFAVHPHFRHSMVLTLGYTACAACALLLWQGSARLCGANPHTRVALLGFALYLLLQGVIQAPTERLSSGRIALVSLFMAACLGFAALQVHRSYWAARLRSVRLLRTLLAASAVLVLLRMAAIVLEITQMQPDGRLVRSTPEILAMLLFGTAPFAYTITALSIANALLSTRLHQLATTDDLTGLTSRRSLNENAQRMLERMPQAGCVALLMIDLDQFKGINDRHGHSVGDDVLRHVADVLRQQLRSDSLIARYGGDEFCALVPAPGEAAAFVVAERLRAAMEGSPYRSGDGLRIPMTLSIGVTLHRHGATLRQLLDEADRRAYLAKAGGRNRVVDNDRTAA